MWSTWALVGFLLLGLELFVPTGFYLFIVGLSSLLVGLGMYVGALQSLSAQLIVFGILGVFQFFTIRRPLAQLMHSLGKESGSAVTHQEVTIVDHITPGSIGKGELSGASWNVRNDSESLLEAGKRYAVKKIEGITLIVR